MEISHEVPTCFLEESRNFNDYDYALVHLFEDNPKYLEFYEESVRMGRKVVLDNSIFELGSAFNSNKFREWIEILKPTHYIIPDDLEDMEFTLGSAFDWLHTSPPPGIKIGVVQGSTLDELVQCYVELDRMGIDEFAISFDYSIYREMFPHYNYLVSWAMGRVLLVNKLISLGVVNYNKPHHLLGVSLPVEFSFYKERKYGFLTSLDTSNPITLALEDKLYGDTVLLRKPEKKLFESINTIMDPRQYSVALQNIKHFRKMVNQ